MMIVWTCEDNPKIQRLKSSFPFPIIWISILSYLAFFWQTQMLTYKIKLKNLKLQAANHSDVLHSLG
jgi:hypothetical protein